MPRPLLPRLILSLGLLLPLALTACSHVQRADVLMENVPLLATNVALPMPRPGDLGRSVEATQMLTLRRESDVLVLEVRLSITPERFLLVGFDGLGRRAMSITLDERGMTVEKAPWVPGAVRPGSMLADIFILYWPEDVVRAALVPGGATLVADEQGRSVRLSGRVILDAHYDAGFSHAWDSPLTYRNLSWGYEISVQSAELSR